MAATPRLNERSPEVVKVTEARRARRPALREWKNARLHRRDEPGAPDGAAGRGVRRRGRGPDQRRERGSPGDLRRVHEGEQHPAPVTARACGAPSRRPGSSARGRTTGSSSRTGSGPARADHGREDERMIGNGTLYRGLVVVLVATSLAACVPVTVNVTFPQQKLDDAASQIVDMSRRPADAPASGPTPGAGPQARLAPRAVAGAPRAPRGGRRGAPRPGRAGAEDGQRRAAPADRVPEPAPGSRPAGAGARLRGREQPGPPRAAAGARLLRGRGGGHRGGERRPAGHRRDVHAPEQDRARRTWGASAPRSPRPTATAWAAVSGSRRTGGTGSRSS